MVVLSSSISAKVSKMSRHECKGYKWQCPTTQSPTEQHNEPQRKVLGRPSDGPSPPPGERQGVGNDQGGRGYVPTAITRTFPVEVAKWVLIAVTGTIPSAIPVNNTLQLYQRSIVVQPVWEPMPSAEQPLPPQPT